MKKNIIITYILSIAIIGFILSGCQENDELKVHQYPEQTVGDFNPTIGRPGNQITINGSNFGTYKGAVTIFFNGQAAPKENIISVTDNKIVVVVPDNAASGPISVKVWTYTKETATDFTFIPGAKVTGISPAQGSVGQDLTITGENFGTDPTKFTVEFNGGVPAIVKSVTDTQIVVTVPAGGSTGPITIIFEDSFVKTPVFSYPFVGLNYQFNTNGYAEGWVSTHSSTNEVSGGSMNVTFNSSQFVGTSKRRADFQLTGGAEVHAGLYPIIAIKLNKPATGNFILDTNLGSYKNGSNNYDGILLGDIYYYDIRNTFGAGAKLSQTEPTKLTTFQWKIADITSPETGYSVDWVQSFENLAALNAYASLPEGKYIFEFDDANATGDWLAAQNATTKIEGGKFKVTFDPAQFTGTNKRRADFYNVILGKFPYPGGADKASWIYNPEYPIIAMKITFNETGDYKPAAGNIKLDPYTGANNTYLTDFVGKNVIYYDVSDKYTERTELNVWQFKIADITSAETGYQIDWVRTFKSKAELNAFLN
ncbi:DUF4979 domain-containing protein [Mariniflexile jejuense]|uniref:DUF4979 domain-containing protein n=1 Tax=Mariniflexile jejuense TaxID=1173582 RepID=A0ABW3JML5_9FLAO